MSTLSAIREADGLEEYLDAIEERLARSVASHPGLVRYPGGESADACAVSADQRGEVSGELSDERIALEGRRDVEPVDPLADQPGLLAEPLEGSSL